MAERPNRRRVPIEELVNREPAIPDSRRRVPLDARWVLAAMDVQETGKFDALSKMLRSNRPLREAERRLIADLLDRGRFQKKRGRPMRPMFKSSAETRLYFAGRAVKRLMLQGKTQGNAIMKVAADPYWRIKSAETLTDFVNGRRGAPRRKRTRPKIPGF